MVNNFEKASTKLDTHYGNFDFHCYSWGPHEEDHILCLSNLQQQEEVLTRVQSACYTAEIFRSRDCDCHEQLDESIKKIAKEGGLVIYMLCDGRGAGLLSKVRGLELGRTQGMDTSEAYKHLQLEQDPRTYERVVTILNDLQVASIKLLTNNPRKIKGIADGGIKVVREPLEIRASPFSAPYLKTKTVKMGHMMRQFSNDQVQGNNSDRRNDAHS